MRKIYEDSGSNFKGDDMKVEISNGDVVDRWTILRIKQQYVKSEDAQANVKRELDIMTECLQQLDVTEAQVSELLAVNWALWEIEDKLRVMESEQDFGDGFVERARSVYLLNDDRARLKKEINEQTDSLLVEEKLYSDYEVPADD